jgi:hypothetical protein
MLAKSKSIYFIKIETVTSKLCGTALFQDSQSAVCRDLPFLLSWRSAGGPNNGLCRSNIYKPHYGPQEENRATQLYALLICTPNFRHVESIKSLHGAELFVRSWLSFRKSKNSSPFVAKFRYPSGISRSEYSYTSTEHRGQVITTFVT